jgi:microcystin-dependent protein
MPYNGNGVFSIINTFAPGTTISSSAVNANYTDIATGLSNCLTRNGLAPMTAALEIVSGNSSAPGLAFASEPTFGLYRSAASTAVLTGALTTTGALGGSSIKENGHLLVPAGVIWPYGGSAAPTGFLLCDGTSYLRATYPALFTAIGTTYGAADGTHFSVPDLRGRIPAGIDPTGTRLTSTTMSPDGNTLGATGGAQTETLTLSQLPTGITSNGSNSISVTSANPLVKNASLGINPGAASATPVWFSGTSSTETSSNPSQAISVTSNNTGGTAHVNVQPTILTNYIIYAGV